MKKPLLLFLFCFCRALFAFSSEPKEENNNWTFNGGISFLFPTDGCLLGDNDIVTVLMCGSVFAGIGYHININDKGFSPGVYADLHLNLLPVLFLLLMPIGRDEVTDEDIENINNVNRSNPFFILQAGIRLYNQFRFEYFDIQPFLGINVIAGSIYTSVLRTVGILAAYKEWGVEYSFQQFLDKPINAVYGSVHRIVLCYHRR
jgi:hypothetical protein